MKKKPYKILLLADLKKSTSSMLKSTVSFAQMIHGEIDFFYVKKAIDVVERDNQLSAIRSINHDYTATDNKIKKLIKTASENHQININYSCTIGNVKHEISNQIKEIKPDIIVLGKKKSSPLNLVGDNITQFILKQFDGTILIADTNNVLEPHEKLSLGVLDANDTMLNTTITESLMAHTDKPIKSFKIVKKTSNLHEATNSSTIDTIDYVFEHNDNSIDTLSNYVSKNNINLLCLERSETGSKKKSKSAQKDIRYIIDKLNVSLLLTGKKNYSLQK
ncbi:universal stress protein [Mariniflexile soesokkakense]|uniref:Universal stress protein n=1 Tax=Mariniflexile soesokkakense TaxID=1343160 RepID=A0ABV0ADJ6_9FLAO